MERIWKGYGNDMERICKVDGKNMERIWKGYGKDMERRCKENVKDI